MEKEDTSMSDKKPALQLKTVPDQFVTPEQLIGRILTEIDKRKKRMVQSPLSWDTFAELLRDTLNPQAEEIQVSPLANLKMPPPEFPKLKVYYDRKADYQETEFLVVNNANEEDAYRSGGWLTRPMEELEMLGSKGVKERPLSDHDRARDKYVYVRT
jgi:hypothetical protein